jgi:hypothetical protein
MLGTSRRVSPQIILMELGWTPIDADIIATKLRFFEKLKLQPEETYQNQVVRARMDQVRRGSTKGLCYEAYHLWEEIGAPECFSDKQDGKISQQRRDTIEEGAKALTREWRNEWLNDTGGQRNGYYDILYEEEHDT